MFRKLVIIIVVIGLVWSSVVYVPKANATAVWTFITSVNTAISAGANTAMTVKEYILDVIARTIARNLLNNAIAGIINTIQTSGRDGGPAFVQNWRNFQTDAQYRGENVFRSILASTPLCNYVSTGIKKVFGANQVVPLAGQNLRVNNFDPFPLRAACTMPSNFNLTDYQQDFAGNGGWNAWSRMLEPQNNYYGLLFGSLDETSRQRALEESGDILETQGHGYTSVRDSCAGQGSDAKCVFLGKVFTPGDLLGKSAASTIDNDLGWLVSSDELSEVIIAVVSAITNRMINLATSNPSNDYKNAPKADTSSSDGYLACVNSCQAGRDVSCQTNCAKAWGYNPPEASCSGADCITGEEGVPPPTDADTKHGNHAGEVAMAKDELISEGMTFSQSSPECPDRFAITKRAVQKIGGGAGFLDKPGGNNCEGFAVDIIAFPDGYIYDVLNGTTPDGNGPMWGASGCGPVGGDGTCSDRYRAP